MNLHNSTKDFIELSALTAQWKHLLVSAIKRDYFVVLMLDNLANSDYADRCVFKGGTSLSKCYPGSIERFSEDIDLTYLGMEEDDKTCEKEIKRIISIMTVGAQVEKIKGEGNSRNKSRKVWFDTKDNAVKLEIGSSVRPEPYGKRKLKTYIQSYLESRNMNDVVCEFDLDQVEINTLAIERTFIDKIMSVKRHAMCGTLSQKVRHIYDVVRLYQMPEIQSFINDDDELKRILQLTKTTDAIYLKKRIINPKYNPIGKYAFSEWENYFVDKVNRDAYETLHNSLLYTDERQDFDIAIQVFDALNQKFDSIQE